MGRSLGPPNCQEGNRLFGRRRLFLFYCLFFGFNLFGFSLFLKLVDLRLFLTKRNEGQSSSVDAIPLAGRGLATVESLKSSPEKTPEMIKTAQTTSVRTIKGFIQISTFLALIIKRGPAAMGVKFSLKKSSALYPAQ